MNLADALDLNSNGVLGFPDLLGWLFFATVGLLGVAVCAGMAGGALYAVGRAARAGALGLTSALTGAAQVVGRHQRR
jgi:hypothetical protein